MSKRDLSPKRTRTTYFDQIMEEAEAAMSRQPDLIFFAPREKPALEQLLLEIDELPEIDRMVKLYASVLLALFWSDISGVVDVRETEGFQTVGFSTERGVMWVGEGFLRHNRYRWHNNNPDKSLYGDLAAFVKAMDAHRVKTFKKVIWPLDSFIE